MFAPPTSSARSVSVLVRVAVALAILLQTVLPVSSSAALAASPAAELDGWRQAPSEETIPGGNEGAPPAKDAALSPSTVNEDTPLTKLELRTQDGITASHPAP
jgi:hypothetical protein